MSENTTKHIFVIDKWKRHGKVVSLRIRRKRNPSSYIFFVKVDPPVPIILYRTPEYIKEFVDGLNKGIIKLNSMEKLNA